MLIGLKLFSNFERFPLSISSQYVHFYSFDFSNDLSLHIARKKNYKKGYYNFLKRIKRFNSSNFE